MHSAEDPDQEHAGGYYPPDQSQQQRGSGLMGHSSGSFIAEDSRIQNSTFFVVDEFFVLDALRTAVFMHQ